MAQALSHTAARSQGDAGVPACRKAPLPWAGPHLASSQRVGSHRSCGVWGCPREQHRRERAHHGGPTHRPNEGFAEKVKSLQPSQEILQERNPKDTRILHKSEVLSRGAGVRRVDTPSSARCGRRSPFGADPEASVPVRREPVSPTFFLGLPREAAGSDTHTCCHAHTHSHSCIHANTRTYTCIHTHTRTHAHMHTRTRINTHVCTHAHTSTRIHTCTHMFTCTCTCAHKYARIGTHMYKHARAHTHRCAHTHAHTPPAVLPALRRGAPKWEPRRGRRFSARPAGRTAVQERVTRSAGPWPSGRGLGHALCFQSECSTERDARFPGWSTNGDRDRDAALHASPRSPSLRTVCLPAVRRGRGDSGRGLLSLRVGPEQ